nr:immunoglobulin heavy chain junction region [Mus musculus]
CTRDWSYGMDYW